MGSQKLLPNFCLQGSGYTLELGKGGQRWACMPGLQLEEVTDVNILSPLDVAEG